MSLRTLGQNRMVKRVGITLFLLQATFVIFFAIFGRYDEEARSDHDPDSGNSFHHYYGMFQDVHVMIFIGFGFLMTFLRRYGFSAVGYNFLLSAVAIQWYTIVHAIIKVIFWNKESDGEWDGVAMRWSMTTLVAGDFAAGAVLISFGVLLGKTSPCQLLALVLLEIPIYAINETILVQIGTADAGGSLIIHMFGAYFGLACSMVLRKNWSDEDEDNASVYHSDLFSMIGTVFLWMYWPSFNGVLVAPDDGQHRVAINTYFSLCACVLATFGTSVLVEGKGKLDMVHIQNATLAGGVAVGTTANFMIQPYGAAIIGTLAGILSTLGYTYVSPFLQDKAGLHDTCGVHNLHGMPAILAGLAGIVGAFLANTDSYGEYGLAAVFPQGERVVSGESSSILAIVQAGAMGITLIMSIVGGLVAGICLRFFTFCDPVEADKVFLDERHWGIPDPYPTTPFGNRAFGNSSIV